MTPTAIEPRPVLDLPSRLARIAETVDANIALHTPTRPDNDPFGGGETRWQVCVTTAGDVRCFGASTPDGAVTAAEKWMVDNLTREYDLALGRAEEIRRQIAAIEPDTAPCYTLDGVHLTEAGGR